jgi:hypothetical protein
MPCSRACGAATAGAPRITAAASAIATHRHERAQALLGSFALCARHRQTGRELPSGLRQPLGGQWLAASARRAVGDQPPALRHDAMVSVRGPLPSAVYLTAASAPTSRRKRRDR